MNEQEAAEREREELAAAEAAELTLVSRCRTGEEAACRKLYLLHAPGIHRLARRLGAPPGELDDVVQEVFSRAFQHFDRFHGGKLQHWLGRLCTNVVTDHHRRRRVRTAFGLREAHAEAPPGPQPEEALLRRQAEQQVSEILARLRPKHREVFVLFELERLSSDEIAERIGCPPGTVRTRLFHARQAFLRIGRRRGYIEGEAAG